MAEVALQAYENEIDQMIEEARYLEALAHLRHILNKHPRYLGAYYLLGKMLLEADLPELAVDMFRRVLNADPEHFLARIGLGLAHDHLAQPQAAIWNLEQAFELASGDEAIHDELRRLVGQRDGTTPDHIQMSRAGLARLYLRGNLFSRAVEEFRALVAAHPERADLQVALTEAYWRDDQIVLAAESCQKILDTFPYSLKANLLLGVLLQNSGQEGSARYLQRAQEVDPENRVAGTLFGANGPVPTKSRTIERLVYDPATLDVDQKARWFRNLEAASVSVGISETMPQMTETEMRLVDVTADLESQIQIPEWLRDLGPLEEIGAEAESAEWSEEESGEPEDIIGYEELAGWLKPQRAETPAAVEDAAIPDWLQSLQPPDVEATLEPVSDEEIPEWLRDMQPAESSTIPPRPSEDQAEEALPDWLAELRPAETAAAAGIAAAHNLADEELPEWLREAAPAAAAAPESESPAIEDEDLGWLQDLQASAPAMTPAVPTEAVESDDMFGWEAFSGHEPEAIAEQREAIEALPDWLADLKPPVAAAEAGVAAKVEEEALEELPEWLSELKPPVAEAKAEAEITAAEAEGMFGWLSFPEAEPAAAEVVPAAEEELPEWLAELKPPVAAAEAGVAAEVEEEALEELPEWLSELKPPVAEAKAEAETTAAEAEEMFGWLSFPEAKPAAAEVVPAAEEELPDWLADLKPPVAAAEAGVAAKVEEEALEELPEWLAELKPPVAAAETGIATEAEEEALEELPEWLSELKPPVAEAKVEAETTAAEAEGMFGWLSFPEAEPAAAEVAPAAEEELPEWLAELKPPVAAAETGIASEAEEEALEELPEWLAELKPPVAAAETGVAAEVEEEALEELPEWLSELKPPVAEAKAEAEPTAAEAEEMFGWLSSESEPAAAEVVPAAEEELPEWLAELKPPVAAAEAGIAAEVEEEALEELPEWLSELKPPVAEAKAEAEPTAAEAEEMFGWLSFPEAEPVAAEAALAAEEELPEWLAELKPPVAAAEAAVAAEAEGEALEDLPEWLAELKPSAAPAEAGIAAGVAEPAIPSLEGEMMSGDDALAWLASLAAGKEEQLRAQAEAETRARVDEIMGRKPTAPLPTLEPEAPAPVAEPSAVEPVAAEPMVAEAPAPGEGIALPAEEPAAPSLEGEMMSGDDALAWLASLAAGKEEQLRGQAETETRARVDEIMGRKPTALLPTLEPAAVEPAIAEVPAPEESIALEAEGIESEAGESAPIILTAEEEVTATLEEIISTSAPLAAAAVAAEEEEAFFGWSGFEPEVAEAETNPEPEILESEVLTPASFLHAGPESEAPVDQRPEEVKIAEPVLAQPEPGATAEAAPPIEAAPPAEAAPPVETPAPAVDALRARVQADAKDYPSRLELARTLVSQDALQEAMDHYGRLVRERQSLTEIETDLTQMLERQPDDPRPLQTLGDLNMQKGRLDKAMEFYKRALSKL